MRNPFLKKAPQPVAARPCEGYVDTTTREQISGWVHDPVRPQKSLFVNIDVNGEHVACVRANLPRPDLREAGLDNCHKGFAFDPRFHLKAAENHVRVTYADSDQLVTGGDFELLNVRTFDAVAKSSEADLLELSQVRWKGDEEEARLTWGTMMTADSFLDVVRKHHTFTGKETVVEIGPGYGRLLNGLFEHKTAFAKYVGLEISATRVGRLAQRFQHPTVTFIHADILVDALDIRADLVLCSSTFEHLFPSMQKALHNLRKMAHPKTKLFIDFILCQGDDDMVTSNAYFESTAAYIRMYSRTEVETYFAKAGFRVRDMERIVLGKDANGRDVRRALFFADVAD